MFPCWNPELCGLCHSQVVPPGLSVSKCGNVQSTSYCLSRPVLQLPSCQESESFLPQLPISAPTTSLDECFFFNSLVVRLSYSSIFWLSVYFLFLNFLLSFWLCEEAKCIYLCLHLGQKYRASAFFININIWK